MHVDIFQEMICFCQEFDRHESKKVQELFDAIDLILYENRTSGPLHLCRECCEWTSRFPHLRYLSLTKYILFRWMQLLFCHKLVFLVASLESSITRPL